MRMVLLGAFAGAVAFLAFVLWWAAFALTGDAALAKRAAAWAGFGAAEAGLFALLTVLSTPFFGGKDSLASSLEPGDYALLAFLLFLGGGFLGVLGCVHWAVLAGEWVGDLIASRLCMASALIFPAAALAGLVARAVRGRRREA